MERILRHLVITAIVSVMFCSLAKGQAIKVNTPFLLTGSPNVGAEFTVSKQFSLNGDVLWMPYMFKSKEEVFRAFQTSVDLRYYFKPKYYHTNDLWDGFYLGPYAMFANYNIGMKKKKFDNLYDNDRYVGWAVSAGVSLGYKFYISDRFRLDVNMGLGYAHLQYDVYPLGGEWNYKKYRKSIKDTKMWIGPTKFGIHLVYNIFR